MPAVGSHIKRGLCCPLDQNGCLGETLQRINLSEHEALLVWSEVWSSVLRSHHLAVTEGCSRMEGT